jgi:hypothetical protein
LFSRTYATSKSDIRSPVRDRHNQTFSGILPHETPLDLHNLKFSRHHEAPASFFTSFFSLSVVPCTGEIPPGSLAGVGCRKWGRGEGRKEKGGEREVAEIEGGRSKG